jgi:hypothetical protein
MTAVEAQAKEGYWTLGWDEPKSARPAHLDASSFRLLITGHLLEWMEYLPLDLQPDAEIYYRAGQWLCSELGRMPRSLQVQEFCPWTHAVCSVRNLVGEASESDTNTRNSDRSALLRVTEWLPQPMAIGSQVSGFSESE